MKDIILKKKIGTSQRKLLSSYAELLHQKNLDKITVSELCDKAQVNRSTFYRLYYDIFDFAEKAEAYCSDTIIDFCVKSGYRMKDVFDNIRIVLENDEDFEDFSLCIDIASHLGNRFCSKVYEKIIEHITNIIYDVYGEREITVNVVKFLTNGINYYANVNKNSFDKESFFEVASMLWYAVKRMIVRDIFKYNIEFCYEADDQEYSLETDEKRTDSKRKRNFYKAYVQLICEKGDSKISVSQLCEKAEMSHSTFYNHYADIDDFVNAIYNDYLYVSEKIATDIFFLIKKNRFNLNSLKSLIEEGRKLFSAFNDKNEFLESSNVIPDNFTEILLKCFGNNLVSKFDKNHTLKFVCYCAWSSLYFPCCDEAVLSAEVIMESAYKLVIGLFDIDFKA